MLIDDQMKTNDADDNPVILSTNLDKVQEQPIPLTSNNEDADMLEKKTLAKLIQALNEKDTEQNSHDGPEIRLPSTGDEPVPLKELMTPEDSMSESEESSGEMAEGESKESVEIWENPDVFDSIIGIPSDASEGSTVVQLTAHHPQNLSMDFLCINPHNVLCYSDKLSDNKYQLRVVLSGTTDIPNHFVIRFHVLIPDAQSGVETIFEDKTYVLNFSYEAEQTTSAPISKSTVMNVVVNSNHAQVNHNAKPVFEFMPQFEKDTYDIMVPEGQNEKPMTIAIIYFMGRVNGPAPVFAVVDDSLGWFEIGEITAQQDPNRVLSAVKLLLKKDVKAVKGSIQVPYHFTIEAKQADTTAHALVNVDLLSFDDPEPTKDQVTETVQPTVVPSTSNSPTSEATASTGGSALSTLDEMENELQKLDSLSKVQEGEQPEAIMESPPLANTSTGRSITEEESSPANQETTLHSTISTEQPSRIPDDKQSTTTLQTTTFSSPIEETTEKTVEVETKPTTTTTQSTTSSATRTAPVTTRRSTIPVTLPDFDISLIITGISNGKAVVSELLRNGEVVPDVEIRVMADQEHNNELVDLELSPTEAFIVRPRRIQIGGSAQLIVANNHLLDYETYPSSFTVEVRAVLVNNQNVVRTQKIDIEKKDELDHAPYFYNFAFYEFDVPENSVTGEAVGQLSVRDDDKNDELTFELFGESKELFAVNDNVLIVSCKTALPCLDRERTSTYYFALVATDKAGHSSDPVTITIHVNDKNDNGPKIGLTEDVLRISNGELLAPFVFTVADADLMPSYVIETDGSAGGFLEISKVSDGLYQIKPKLANIPSAGNFELELTARDPSNETGADKKTIKVQVKNTISKAHFRRPRYERTITSEKVHKGNPLVQLELEGVPIDTVRFVILNNNPGWLSIDDYGGNVFVGDTPTKGVASGHRTVDIGVIDRQTQNVLAQTQLILTVVGNRKTESLFKERVYTQTVSKEAPLANTVVVISTTDDKPNILVTSDSIVAWNIEHKPEHFPVSAITVDGNSIVLSFDFTTKLRSLQFQVANVEDLTDRALITVYFSSDPVKEAQKRKQNAKPQFVAPWTPESIVLPVKLVEEAPIGHIAASLPAYDPMTGNRVTAVELKGQMADFFSIDPITQDVLVAKRIDFEALSTEMKAFDLELIAGDDEYKTTAILRFQILDVDDNTPRIEFLNNEIKNNVIMVMENSPPGTEIARFQVLDDDVLDGKQKFSYQITGFNHDNFQIREVSDYTVLVVSPAAELDREKNDRMEIVLRVTDSAGNSNVANLIITLDDQNDNPPKFLEDRLSVKLTENWQVGSTVARLIASDADLNENSRLSFYIGEESSPYFDVDEDSGVISTLKSLNGLARIEPYRMTVICRDNGRPQLSAEAVVSITVVEAVLISNEGKNELTIQSPPIGHVLKLSENTPQNHRVYQVKAQLGRYDVADIKYSLTPISKKDDGLLNIDETSGEIFTAKRLDYEKTKRITVGPYVVVPLATVFLNKMTPFTRS
uniref:Cadherin domain-containing protein n=1 Tax=Steinernema glaseri TaxID=37863 RepID=A0A1I8A9S2_9BILA